MYVISSGGDFAFECDEPYINTPNVLNYNLYYASGANVADDIDMDNYDLSPYLHKEERPSPRDVLYEPPDNITYRRKSGISLPTRKEPCFPEFQGTNTGSMVKS